MCVWLVGLVRSLVPTLEVTNKDWTLAPDFKGEEVHKGPLLALPRARVCFTRQSDLFDPVGETASMQRKARKLGHF